MSRLISIYNLPPSPERGMRAVQVVLTDGDRAHGCTLYRAVCRREPSVEASPTSYDVTVKSTHALRDEAYAALCARLEANGWQKLALDELDDFAVGKVWHVSCRLKFGLSAHLLDGKPEDVPTP